MQALDFSTCPLRFYQAVKAGLLKELHEGFLGLANVAGEKSEHDGTIARLFHRGIDHLDELEIFLLCKGRFFGNFVQI